MKTEKILKANKSERKSNLMERAPEKFFPSFTVLHKVNLSTHLLMLDIWIKFYNSPICVMSSEFFDVRETGDAKGKANWSTSGGEEDASSWYTFLYYAVRPDTSRRRKGKFASQRVYIGNTNVRCNISRRETDLRRRSSSDENRRRI